MDTTQLYKDYAFRNIITLLDSTGEVIPLDDLSLYKEKKIQECMIVFNFDEVFKEYPSIESITNNTLSKKYITTLVNRLHSSNYSDRNTMIKLFVCTLPLSTSYKKKLISNINNIPQKWTKLFDSLFVTGVPVDMHHTHGGEHNSYTIPHIGHTYPLAVRWIAHFLGVPYGHTLTLNGNSNTYLKFDSSGLDTPQFRFLNHVLNMRCTYGVKGLDLFKLLGPVRVWTPNQEHYNYHNYPEICESLVWPEQLRAGRIAYFYKIKGECGAWWCGRLKSGERLPYGVYNEMIQVGERVVEVDSEMVEVGVRP